MDKGLLYECYRTEEELKADREAQKARVESCHYEYEYEGMSEAEKAELMLLAKAKGLQPVFWSVISTDKTYEWNDIVKGKILIELYTLGGDFVF